MDISPNLKLPFILPSQAQKHVTHNEALLALDALVQLSVKDRDLAAPPAAADGDRYIVATGASGAWTGQSNRIAGFQDGVWTFYPPLRGWLAFVADENVLLVWDGTAWTNTLAETALATITRLGVNSGADTTNRLTVSSQAVLFNHAGAGMQLKLNKASAGQTASLLYQSNWSGRAEMGLAGDDHFRIKVSADGSSWNEAFRADAATGDGIIGELRPSRDTIANTLPDSGRFNGNANNAVYSGIAYTAPTYFTVTAGSSIASHAKFINDNTDFGGAAGALDAEVKALVQKIRATTTGRRYGPEWFVMRAQNTAGALTEQRTHLATNYGLPFTNALAAMPARFTYSYYVKVKTGSALLAVDQVLRASIDGAPVTSGSGATPVVLTNGDGWKHINLEAARADIGYNHRMAQLLTTVSGEVWITMPKLVFGHVNLDPNLGVLINTRLFG
ncbi:DUF2793 domain-containing protein [Mesorhizobium sp. NBSH29]|uniref:DUF2793 domain-containing protein n=1 Tax=Mesorhizobium sp. NBSH29 TaxID=2654249 RepID=UPI0018968660|nr:DUF2793 domain-containing protein [Mesorhizobium sp. NBSH29]